MNEAREGNGLGIVGLIGRFKPLHNGGAALLESVCEQAEHVIIGIGSCNRYDLRNPFTAEETKGMIDTVLSPRFMNYEVIYVPDFAHDDPAAGGQKWREHVLSAYGGIDHFVSGNDYVRELLKDDYVLLSPEEVIPVSRQIFVRGTRVRFELARDGDWKSSVPGEVAAYLEQNHLVDRFRDEFGKQMIDRYSGKDISMRESSIEEYLNVLDVRK
ncbi:MAG: adenylyltransferase/cytidyltransferase family protein [Candidatus Woesearchaeota archaeon]